MQFGYSFGNSEGHAILYRNSYNELGILMKKQLHSENNGATFLQDIDYRYNERGWLTDINDPDNISGSRLFGMKISYNHSVNGSLPQYNKNIGGIKWQTGVPSGMNMVQQSMSYGFQYDALDRLTGSIYGQGTSNVHYFDESLTYDKAGNILSLNRNGEIGNVAGIIDQLRYIYAEETGNQLNSIQDNSGRNEGLKAGTFEYVYDSNGNVIEDNSKGIASIIYNDLNLPQTVYASRGTVNYVYDATGRKLSKMTSSGEHFYLDNWEFDDSQGVRVRTDEGIASKSNGIFSFEYHLTDHLGNVRAAVGRSTSGTAQVLQVNHYYPFGMSYQGSKYQYTSSGAENKYLYNGKEIQDELGQYDYGARFYDPIVGRWNTADPLAETSRRWSPYTYANNNPLRFIDPDGMASIEQIESYAQMLESQRQNAEIRSQTAEVIAAMEESEAILRGEDPDPNIEKKSTDKGGDPKGANKGGGKNMSGIFDAQLRATEDFFSAKSEELNSMTLFTGAASLTRLLYFTEMVKTNAPYDLKNHGYSEALIGRYSSYHGKTMRFDDYGNYNYGVAARAYGISLDMALFGAGLNQVSKWDGDPRNFKGWFDDRRDTEMIIRGYNAKIK